jgi:hypothetical protein
LHSTQHFHLGSGTGWKLYAAEVRNADLEAQNKSLVEQLLINREECNALAQLCRLA